MSGDMQHCNGVSNGHIKTHRTVVVGDQQQAFFISSYKRLCTFSISLPLTGLFVCFTTACAFQNEQIMETSCRVYNLIPSISAIIGIAPQCYFWRLLVAFHLGPRLLLPPVYYRFYKSHERNVPAERKSAYAVMNLACYWTSLIEIVAFTGVSYISNRDNYPIHEKMFITYLTSSLLYMMISMYVFSLAKPIRSRREELSFRIKKWCLTIVLLGVGVMIYFYRLHRVYCTTFAFSWFALSEYVVAVANMGFHYTLALDFPQEKVSVGNIFQAYENNHVSKLNRHED